MGQCPNIDITGAGIFVYPYEEDGLGIDSLHLNLDIRKASLILGDHINDLSEMSAYNLKLRGMKLKTSLLDSKIEVFGGRSNESKEATGTYAQYNGGIRISRAILPSLGVGLNLLSSSDDKGSISDPQGVNPLSNLVLGGDVTYSPNKGRQLIFEYSNSSYDENKIDNVGAKKDKSYKVQAEMTIRHYRK